MLCDTCRQDKETSYISHLSTTTCEPDADGRAYTKAIEIKECAWCFKKSWKKAHPGGLFPAYSVEFR